MAGVNHEGRRDLLSFFIASAALTLHDGVFVLGACIMKDLLNSEPRLKNLRAHAETWSPTTRALIEGLLEEDQAHLFYDWDPPGIADEKKARFLTQLSGVRKLSGWTKQLSK